MKKLLILGASEFQIPLIRQAKKMGIYTCAVDISDEAAGFKFADEFRVCSVKDTEKILEIAKNFKPDGITAGMVDVAVYTTAVVCEKLSLPGLSPYVAKQATNKLLMIQAFQKNNVPHPFYKYIRDINELDCDYLPFPLVSKPIDMAGSRGINYIPDSSELHSSFEASRNCSDSGEVILEEFMVGPEVSVEILVKGTEPVVLQITDKLTTGKPSFMELGHSQPSQLPYNTKALIQNVACKAVKALDLIDCIVHAELIITSDGPKMVELGARMGGDCIDQYLIEYSTGINLQEIAIKIALGEEFDIPSKTINNAAAIRFIQCRPGVVKDISYNETLINEAEICRIYCKKGDIYSYAKDNSGRFGYVVVQSDDPQDAITRCEKIIEAIRIEVD